MSELPPDTQELLPGMPEPVILPRFAADRKRAFGSVPTLLGKEIDVPPFHRLNELALQRTEPAALRKGLYGAKDNNAVNGLALNTQQYEVIIRSPRAFNAAIRNKTLAANMSTNELRKREKELRSVSGSLANKEHRHEGVLAGLDAERQTLTKLSEWQKVPGYWRTREADLRILAASAWQGSFMNILSVLRDQYELTPEEHIDMANALAYKLTRAPQNDRMAHWGGLLGVSLEYNKSVMALFSASWHRIVSDKAVLEKKLDEFYEQSGLQSPEK
jgi:hypothetical protein